MSQVLSSPIQASAIPAAGMGVAAQPALTASDIGAIADFYNDHLADNAVASSDGRRQDRIADNVTALVGEALGIVGNDMPEDIRCALNVIIVAAPVLDAAPKRGADLQRYMDGLKEIEGLLGRGAASIIVRTPNPKEAGLRRELARLLRELKTEIANVHRYRANQLPPPSPAAVLHPVTGASIAELSGQGLTLLKATPATAEAAQKLHDELDATLARLPRPEDAPVPLAALDGDVDAALRARDAAFDVQYPGVLALRKNIETRMAILEQDIALNPLSRKSAFEAKARSTAAAIGVIHRIRLERQDSLSSEKTLVLNNAMAALFRRITAMESQTDNTTLTKHAIQAIMGGKGKYAYRSAAELEKDAPAIAKRIDALVDAVFSADRDGESGEASPVSDMSDDEERPLRPGAPVSPASEAGDPSGLPLSSPVAREEHLMTTFLDKLFTRLDIDAGRNLEALYHKAKVDVRDYDNWANIRRQVQLVHGDRVRNLTSELIPQSGLRLTSGAPAFPALVDGHGQHGVNCHQSADYRHPTNLAQTRLVDENGKELFNATRHGTLSAYDISPNALRDMDDAELAAVIRHLFPARQVAEAAFPTILGWPIPAAEPDDAADLEAIELDRFPAADPLIFDKDDFPVIRHGRGTEADLAAADMEAADMEGMEFDRFPAANLLISDEDEAPAIRHGRGTDAEIDQLQLLIPDEYDAPSMRGGQATYFDAVHREAMELDQLRLMHDQDDALATRREQASTAKPAMDEAEIERLLTADQPLSNDDLNAVMRRIRTDGDVRAVCADRLKKAAAVARAREIALAALAAHPDKLAAAESGSADVSISINTISLLTPDTARGILGWFRNLKGDSTGSADELAMARDQYEAWDHVRRHGIEVDGPDGRKVRVKVEVNDFSFGVNDIEFLFGSSNRDEVRERNTRAMRAVIGDLATDPRGRIGGQAGEWLKTHPYARAVETLAYQVADLWHSGAWRSAGVEPYKLVTRLAVLTHMIGAHPDFNCKSGKDRTGELDIEAKYLAERIDATGEVPEPDAERDGEQRGNFHRLAMEGGNIELQKLNTGVPGYKLKATKRLAKFLGYFEGGRELLSAITLDRHGDRWDLSGESIRAFQGLASFEGS